VYPPKSLSSLSFFSKHSHTVSHSPSAPTPDKTIIPTTCAPLDLFWPVLDVSVVRVAVLLYITGLCDCCLRWNVPFDCVDPLIPISPDPRGVLPSEISFCLPYGQAFSFLFFHQWILLFLRFGLVCVPASSRRLIWNVTAPPSPVLYLFLSSWVSWQRL